MQAWWLSPALVAVGILINMGLGARREAKASGVRDEKLSSLDKRVTAHGIEIDGVKERLGYHGERIAKLEAGRFRTGEIGD